MALAKSGTLQRSASAGVDSALRSNVAGGLQRRGLRAVASDPEGRGTHQADEGRQHGALRPAQLQARFGCHLAHAAGAELRLLLVQQVVELAADADAEGRLEEQQHQAGGADDQVDRADQVVDDHQVEHRQGQHEADGPGEALLRRAHVFGLLLAHEPLPEDQAGRVARVDEDADREVDQEGHHEHARGLEVARQPGVHEGHHGEEEHDARTCAHRALVQHAHRVAVDLFAKAENAVHPCRQISCWVPPRRMG